MNDIFFINKFANGLLMTEIFGIENWYESFGIENSELI